jgi:hypothetical protein
MRLDADAAIIPAEKVRDYLLSPTHTIGRYKSVFFRSLGYVQEHWQVLESDLRATLSNEAEAATATGYGQKFTVAGGLRGPNGRLGRILGIWIILAGETAPRFVTAYPED